MLFRLIYDDALAQAAYLVGCQRTREAVVFDPERDVDRYIDLAASEGLRIVGAAETHIHADFLSGTRELCERVGAAAYLSAEGGPDWSYRWLTKKSGGGSYAHRLLRHNDSFDIGGVRVRAVHTPGHTPEHLCFEITDRGSGAGDAMGLISGDFVFVGDVGRPDLLESAAGQVGAMEPSARALARSLREFNALPEYLQLWPGHGAGSACGKALGAVPQSTVGYEQRFNHALALASDEGAFVRDILSGQPEPPAYFARMKRENRDGPAVLGAVPAPRPISAGDVPNGAAVLDTRPWEQFRDGHLRGALSAPLDRSFPTVAGSFVEPGEDIALVCEASEVDRAVRMLVRVGLDRVVGFVLPSMISSAPGLVRTKEVDAPGARALVASGRVAVLDVRRGAEFEAGHIDGATNIAHVRLGPRIEAVPRGKALLVHCQAGVRSARACAYLEKRGFDVTNLAGGYAAWEKARG
ncbi:MAG TPA: MBL fold metallo-hydrolase [Phycisphaerales bacterium]|nr:MBL fold metallo-hydrolase [Phycisphaerales bacterium]